MMDRHPGRAARGVEEGIEEGPVRYGIRSVGHAFRLAVRTRHRAGIEMIADDHDRRFHFSARHHRVEGESRPMTLTEAQPADARGQSLKSDPLAGEIEPAMKMCIVGEKLLHLAIGLADV